MGPNGLQRHGQQERRDETDRLDDLELEFAHRAAEGSSPFPVRRPLTRDAIQPERLSSDPVVVDHESCIASLEAAVGCQEL